MIGEAKEGPEIITLSRELAEDILNDLQELAAERDWWKEEARCDYAGRLAELKHRIGLLSKLIGVEP